MADIRIKDLATTASTTASDDFMAVDGTTNGTRKLSAATPSFATSVTVPGVSGPTATNLTLAGGSTGASLVLGQGATAANASITPTGTGSLIVTKNSTGNNVPGIILKNGAAGYTELDLYSGVSDTVKLLLQASDVNSLAALSVATNHPLLFGVNASEKMRIATTGNLLIGTTTDISGTGGLKVAGTSTASSTTSGALQVGSNVGLSGNAGGASYFGGDLNVTRASTGLVSTQIYNSTSGTGAISGLEVRANNHTGLIYSLSDAFSSSGQYLAGGTILEARGSAGLMLSGYTSGPVKIWAANALRATIDGTGATFAGDITRSGASNSIITASTSGTSAHGKFNTVADVAQATLRTEGSLTSGTLFSTNRASATQLYSESGPLVLGAFGAFSAVIGTNNTARLTIDSAGAATFAGRIGINGPVLNNVASTLSGIIPNIGLDTNGVGYFSNGTFPASFTGGAHSFYSLPASTASAYTVTNMTGFYAAAPTKGAGSTITNLYGVYVEALTQGTNNYAFRSVGAGLVSIGDSTASTNTTSGALVVTGGVGVGGASYFGGAVTVNAISGINALSAGTQLATFESSVNGAAVELIAKGKNSVGTARQANMGINRFADDVWSLSNGTTEHLRVSLTTSAATFAGTVIAPAATTALAPMRIPHGTAPTSPVNGDMWTTTAGLFVRINGVTVGPLS